MSKQGFDINPYRLKLLVRPFEYKEMAVNVEQVGYIFKYNIYDPKTKNWYSHYVTDEETIVKKKCDSCGHEELKKTEYEPEELVKIAAHVSDMARATIDLILKKDNPDELIEENLEGAAAVEALEANIKLGKKEIEDVNKQSN